MRRSLSTAASVVTLVVALMLAYSFMRTQLGSASFREQPNELIALGLFAVLVFVVQLALGGWGKANWTLVQAGIVWVSVRLVGFGVSYHLFTTWNVATFWAVSVGVIEIILFTLGTWIWKRLQPVLVRAHGAPWWIKLPIWAIVMIPAFLTGRWEIVFGAFVLLNFFWWLCGRAARPTTTAPVVPAPYTPTLTP